ncbi:DUF504 domain-containing protein [Methanospirillum sp.]|uniref:DUF504 domain-containing protein n=2 Tax=Methanospirillum sp. TaxID=45200 RepID=UPI002BC0C4D3|nr:DUF504 domain-containing protein [Methanospirillum sp.]HOL41624.1 DUF504 domain-containing protein [Methanospirillum sp.]HPP77769.1 DUF504 domain-containing protein [Methanospirillum sp.]
MRTTHRILLRIWYDPECDFSKVTIGYLNRGAGGDCSIIHGTEVIRLENRYIVQSRNVGCEEEGYIPYHRIRWIMYDKEIIWSLV